MLKLDTRTDDLATLVATLPRETIATVGDVPLTIPAEVPPAIGLGYARTRLNRGDEMAVTWALELMLGSDGFSLLISSNVDDDGLQTIIEIVTGRIRGATTGTPDAVAGPKAVTSASGVSTARKRAATTARSRAARK